MTLQPTLADGALTLRPLAPGDFDALFAVAGDPAIWAQHPAHDRWREPVFRAFFADALESGGALAITHEGRLIGSSRYDPRRAGPGEVEIGWTFLERAHWGGATNRAVKRLMLAHALRHYERVIFLVGERNVRSRRALEKIGAALTPRTHESVMAGIPTTHVIYAIDREGFATGPLTD